MSKSRCFPYRGRQDDPHFVANFYSQFINKTKLSKNETLFKEGLIQAEKVFEERLQVNKPGLIRKHKELKRNKPSKKAAVYNKNKDAIEEIEKCLCKEDNPCGPDSNCVNRSLFVECGVRYKYLKSRLFQLLTLFFTRSGRELSNDTHIMGQFHR